MEFTVDVDIDIADIPDDVIVDEFRERGLIDELENKYIEDIYYALRDNDIEIVKEIMKEIIWKRIGRVL